MLAVWPVQEIDKGDGSEPCLLLGGNIRFHQSRPRLAKRRMQSPRNKN
jgi:hypothetical protein